MNKQEYPLLDVLHQYTKRNGYVDLPISLIALKTGLTYEETLRDLNFFLRKGYLEIIGDDNFISYRFIYGPANWQKTNKIY